jgi:hypothetical protein
MNAQMIDDLRVVPRLLMVGMLFMTYRVVEWFMTLPEPSLEQAGLVSVMTGALTGSFGLFLGSGKKE